jgi:hypothetical protein
LAIPRLECPPSPSNEQAIERAREFVRATAFEQTSTALSGPLAAAFEQFHDTLLDEDGEARRDWHRGGENSDPSKLILEEIILPVDVEASVHGPWSSARGAIVAPGTLLAATHVVASLGPPNAQLTKLEVEHSTTTYLVSATVLTALGAGLIWLANIFPTLR